MVISPGARAEEEVLESPGQLEKSAAILGARPHHPLPRGPGTVAGEAWGGGPQKGRGQRGPGLALSHLGFTLPLLYPHSQGLEDACSPPSMLVPGC